MTSLVRVFFISCLLVGSAACNGEEEKPKAESSTTVEGQATWLGTGGPCEDLEQVQADQEAKENVGLVFCGNAGKTFTGELRCERNFIEVSCR